MFCPFNTPCSVLNFMKKSPSRLLTLDVSKLSEEGIKALIQHANLYNATIVPDMEALAEELLKPLQIKYYTGSYMGHSLLVAGISLFGKICLETMSTEIKRINDLLEFKEQGVVLRFLDQDASLDMNQDVQFKYMFPRWVCFSKDYGGQILYMNIDQRAVPICTHSEQVFFGPYVALVYLSKKE